MLRRKARDCVAENIVDVTGRQRFGQSIEGGQVYGPDVGIG